MRHKKTIVCPDIYPPVEAGGFLFHTMTYYEYGEPNDWTSPVVCVHGLTRNGRDFERLGEALAKEGYYVICPNIVGRGDSEGLSASAYTYDQYIADMVVLLRHLAKKTGKADPLEARQVPDAEPFHVDWVGTSMGGIIGMKVAARLPGLIRKMVLNDVGPVISKDALNHIAEYVGQVHYFSNRDEAKAHVREVYAEPFGLRDESDVNYLTDISLEALPAGGYSLAYDDRIGYVFAYQMQFGGFTEDYEVWEDWRKVQCPVHILRGKDSYLLSAELVERMKQDPPPVQGKDSLRVTSREFEGCGHAPSLMVPDQIEEVITYLSTRY